jgi:cell wall assembly regulator SMI1
MEEIIKKIDRWLQVNRPVYYAALREPWTTQQFEQIQTLSVIELPALFRALYRWKGGQSALVSENLYDNWRYLQFEEIRIHYQSYNELYEMGEYQQEDWWNPKWVPFLENENGVLMCVDLVGRFEGQPGQLVTFIADDPARTIEFPSLEEFLDRLFKAYEDAENAHQLTSPIQISYPNDYPIVI